MYTNYAHQTYSQKRIVSANTQESTAEMNNLGSNEKLQASRMEPQVSNLGRLYLGLGNVCYNLGLCHLGFINYRPRISNFLYLGLGYVHLHLDLGYIYLSRTRKAPRIYLLVSRIRTLD